MNKISKSAFKIIFKIYNIFAMIIGHLVILTAIGFGIYKLYKDEKLYEVLIGIIIILLLILIICLIQNRILKRKMKK